MRSLVAQHRSFEYSLDETQKQLVYILIYYVKSLLLPLGALALRNGCLAVDIAINTQNNCNPRILQLQLVGNSARARLATVEVTRHGIAY